MKKLIQGALIVATLAAFAPTFAQAQPYHHHHHRQQVCTWHHHHKVCHWR